MPPVIVELLKQENTGKLIKRMAKLKHPDPKKNAGLLIPQWNDITRGAPDKMQSEKKRKKNENRNVNAENENVERNC